MNIVHSEEATNKSDDKSDNEFKREHNQEILQWRR